MRGRCQVWCSDYAYTLYTYTFMYVAQHGVSGRVLTTLTDLAHGSCFITCLHAAALGPCCEWCSSTQELSCIIPSMLLPSSIAASAQSGIAAVFIVLLDAVPLTSTCPHPQPSSTSAPRTFSTPITGLYDSDFCHAGHCTCFTSLISTIVSCSMHMRAVNDNHA